LIGPLLALAMAASPCKPALALDGEPAAVEAVRRELRHAPASEDSGCPALPARIDVVHGALVVTVEGATLKVHDARTAAAWLESRQRSDLSAPLIDLALLGEVRAKEPAIVVATSSDPLPLEVGLRAELGWTGAGAETGAAATFSLGRWPVEPVAILRGATSERLEPAGLAPASRWEAEALAGVRMPWRRGRIALLPGVGIGLGIDGTSRERCAGCLQVVDDDASSVAASMRAEAFVDTSVRLARGFALALSISASASPFTDGAPTLPAWLPSDREGATHLALPAPPAYRLRVGAGVSWSLQ